MNTKIFRPGELYDTMKGEAPDLIVYFEDLSWRSVGTVDYDSIYLAENDTGPDDAVHNYDKIFIIANLKEKVGRNIGTKNILDITPTF